MTPAENLFLALRPSNGYYVTWTSPLDGSDDATLGVQNLYYAELETAVSGSHNDILYVAKVPGLVGALNTVEYINPLAADQPLRISCIRRSYGTCALVVYLATDPTGAVTTTARQLIAALTSQVSSTEGAVFGHYMYARIVDGQNGNGLLAAMAETPLIADINLHADLAISASPPIYLGSRLPSGDNPQGLVNIGAAGANGAAVFAEYTHAPMSLLTTNFDPRYDPTSSTSPIIWLPVFNGIQTIAGNLGGFAISASIAAPATAIRLFSSGGRVRFTISG